MKVPMVTTRAMIQGLKTRSCADGESWVELEAGSCADGGSGVGGGRRWCEGLAGLEFGRTGGERGLGSIERRLNPFSFELRLFED